MRRFADLTLNELRLSLYEMRQYWFETVLSISVMTVVFVGLFFGIKHFVLAGDTGQSLNGLVFGYILWSFASSAYQSASSSITQDTQTGVLEQLFLCPDGFVKLMSARVVAGALFGIVMLLILAFLAMSLTGNWLDINFPLLFLALFAGAPALVGVGFAMGGLTLVFKRVETLALMLSIAFIGLVALDGLPFGFASLLPFTPAVSLSKMVALEATLPSLGDAVTVAANSLIDLIIGLAVFRVCERHAKRKNLIGMY